MKEKSICLVSGGIDSPLASAMISEKMEIIPMHFVLYPYYCEETFSLCMRSLERLRKISDFKKLVLFPWGRVMQTFFNRLQKEDKRNYSCLMCRKGMFLVADMLASDIGANVITTGEALGQKASQTLDNLWTSDSSSETTILRPLIGLDKQEIIERSRSQALFLSKHSGCCDATPEKPRTKSDPVSVQNIFDEICLEEVIHEEFDKVEIIDLEDKSIYIAFYEYLRKLVDSNEY